MGSLSVAKSAPMPPTSRPSSQYHHEFLTPAGVSSRLPHKLYGIVQAVQPPITVPG